MAECIPFIDLDNIKIALEDYRYNSLKALSAETEPAAQELLGREIDSVDSTLRSIGNFACPM